MRALGSNECVLLFILSFSVERVNLCILFNVLYISSFNVKSGNNNKKVTINKSPKYLLCNYALLFDLSRRF